VLINEGGKKAKQTTKENGTCEVTEKTVRYE
jgi:hypothetical protein